VGNKNIELIRTNISLKIKRIKYFQIGDRIVQSWKIQKNREKPVYKILLLSHLHSVNISFILFKIKANTVWKKPKNMDIFYIVIKSKRSYK